MNQLWMLKLDTLEAKRKVLTVGTLQVKKSTLCLVVYRSTTEVILKVH